MSVGGRAMAGGVSLFGGKLTVQEHGDQLGWKAAFFNGITLSWANLL